MLDRSEAAHILQIVDLDMPVIDLITALPQQIADHVLTRAFGAAGGGNRHEIPGGGTLGVKVGVHRIEDFLLCVGGGHRTPVLQSLSESQACPYTPAKSREPWSHGCPLIAIF